MRDAGAAGIDDSRFREILCVPSDADRQEIRRAYRRLVMENHPDRFPPESKQVQELAMISLGEAYSALMRGPGRTCPDGFGRRSPAREPAAAAGHAESPAPAGVGPHRDPAYANYKQGFVNFSIAVRGIAELTRAAEGKHLPSHFPRYRASQDIASSLGLLAAAQDYFARVVDRHPRSVWCADAKAKLSRIRRFTELYRTILSNMGSC